jgi:hypothetical protein
METKIQEKDIFELIFNGKQAVPAIILERALEGMQRAIHLLAMDYEKVEVRQKERISSDIDRKYALFCMPPQDGSIVVPTIIGDPTIDLFASEDINQVKRLFTDCISYISEKNISKFIELIPDRIRRFKIIEAIRYMLPKKSSGIRLNVKHAENIFFDSTQVQNVIKEFLPKYINEQIVQTVTGRLSKIDFDEHKITILYPITNRELECFYDDSIEDLLLEHPRDLIQVTGNVILDDNDHPKKIIDVEDIREVDISPVHLSEFIYSDYKLIFKELKFLTPELDETQQMICLEDISLGIDIVAFTRDELEEALYSELDVLWRNYALCKDDLLTSEAKQLKENLLSAIEAINAERET